MIKQFQIPLFLCIASSLIGGCSSLGHQKHFGCSGMPDGVVCKTPIQVYQLTNGSTDSLAIEDSSEKQEGMFKSSRKSKAPASKEDNIFSRPAFETFSGAMPVLEQPKVLRIWVAPWRDENETLNWPSYMFSEITPKKWSFGGISFRNNPPTAPLVGDFKSPSTDVTAEAAANEMENGVQQDQRNNAVASMNNSNAGMTATPNPVEQSNP